jgi:hypothetical protein
MGSVAGAVAQPPQKHAPQHIERKARTHVGEHCLSTAIEPMTKPRPHRQSNQLTNTPEQPAITNKQKRQNNQQTKTPEQPAITNKQERQNSQQTKTPAITNKQKRQNNQQPPTNENAKATDSRRAEPRRPNRPTEASTCRGPSGPT